MRFYCISTCVQSIFKKAVASECLPDLLHSLDLTEVMSCPICLLPRDGQSVVMATVSLFLDWKCEGIFKDLKIPSLEDFHPFEVSFLDI